MSTVISFIKSLLPRTVFESLTVTITMLTILQFFSSAAHAVAMVF